MKVNDAYPSKFLTAEDLDGSDVNVTIDDVQLEEIGQGADKQKKLVLSFRGKKKGLVVNKTNANTISKVLASDDTDDWIGQTITIGPREVEFKGEMVWSIRVSLKKPGPKKPAPAPEPEPDQDGGGGPEEPGF